MSIKRKFIAIIVVIYVVLGLVFPPFYYAIRGDLRNAALSKLRAIAVLKTERIENFFHSLLMDMDEVRGYWNIKQNMPVLNRHVADLNNPAALVATRVLDQQLRTLQRIYNVFNIMLLTPGGKVVYSSNETYSGKDIRHVNPGITSKLLALARTKAVLSRILHETRPHAGFEMYVLGPAHNREGEFIGFIAFELDMRSVYDMIQHNVGMGASGETIIARKVAGQITFLNNLRYLPGAALRLKLKTGSSEEAIPMQRALSGKGGVGISTDYRGQTVIAAWRYIPLLHWGLVAKIDAAEAFAPIVKLGRLSIGVVSVLALLLFGLFFYVSQSITAPLLKLREGAKRLGEGEFSFRLSINSNDEIGRMATVFNKMAAILEESYRDLESKIAVRTRAIQLSHDDAMIALNDITTQKKRAEDALTKLEKSSRELKNLALFADLNPAPVLRLDHRGRILLANKAANSIFAVEKLAGKYLAHICPALGDDTTLGESAPGQGARQVDIMLHNQELLFSFYHVPDSGEINVYGADVSLLKETERRQQKLIRKQEDMRLTMLNIMDDLKKTTQRVEEATRAKSDFLANMSHEIRTPMNAILGMSYLALQTELNPKQKNYLIKIDLAARSLLGTINDILDFSKIEAGKLRLEAVDFALPDVLANVHSILEARARKKKSALYLLTTPAVPVSLHGDPLRLGQILLNLTGNALKFTEAGEVVVSVDLDHAEGNNIRLKFCVTDTGIGISPEQQHKLFHAFTQADTSITRKYGGTGLGLTISRQLVELMGGEIRVDSALGQGSIFSFTVTFQRAAAAAAAAGSVYHAFPDWWYNGSVLVVDTEKSTRLMLSDILKSFSLKIKEADSGLEALRKLTKAADTGQIFELIILKDLLPNEDAIDICRRIITDQIMTPAPAIIMLVPTARKEEIAGKVRVAGLAGIDVVEQSTPSALFEAIVHLWNSKKGGMSVPIPPHDPVNPRNFRGTRVLVAEDNELNKQVVRELLERLEIEVDIADNGKEAVKTAMANKYDLIFMDIQMPEMDGLAATKEIREWEKLSTTAGRQIIPIIAMTAHAMVGDREKSLVAGMNEHITKPIDPAKLHACLSRWLKPAYAGRRDKNLLANKKGLPAAEKEPANFPLAIPGINLSLGLHRAADNKTLYLELLSIFQREYTSFPAQADTALDLNDIETAKRLVHNMKGAAGTIGALEVAAKAMTLEIAIGKEAEDVPELLKETSKHLQRVLAALRESLPAVDLAASVDTPAGVENFESIAPQIDHLRKLLELSNMEAVDVFQGIKKVLLVLYPEQAAQLGLALESFDFKKACTIVTEIKASKNNKGK